MKDFVIFTDSSCDLSKDILNKLDIKYIGLNYSIKGKNYVEGSENSLPIKEFYDILKNEDEMPSTSQINAYTFKENFEPYIKKE